VLLSQLIASIAMAADALDKSISINVAANTRLEDALIDWGSKVGVTVMINTPTVEGKVTESVHGTLSARRALEVLLRNSALSYTVEGNRIRIVAQGASPMRSALREESGVGAPAFANSDAPMNLKDESDRQGDTHQVRIEEVLVTAERREEKLEKVPISITALSQQSMDDLHIESTADLATVVPGLVLTSRQSFQDFGDIGIRGVFSSNGGGPVGNAPTTQIYIDETPIAIRQLGAALSKSIWPDIFDLQRVEVLRGPQGTLFGASAMGGAIRFITPQPSLREQSGFAKAEGGYTQGGGPSYEVGAAYGAPVVTGTAGFRVSAWFQSLGGFIDQENPFTGQILEKNSNTSNAYVVRPAFVLAPTESLTITPSLFIERQHRQNSDSYWLNGLQSPEAQSHVWGGKSQPGTDTLKVWSLSLKYNFAGVSLVSDTSFMDRKSSAVDDITNRYEAAFSGGNPFLSGLESYSVYDLDLSSTRAWQQELRLSSLDSSSRVNWVAGAFYRRAVQRLQQLEPPDLTPLTEAAFGLTSLETFGVPNFIYNGQALNFYDDFHSTDISEAIFGDVAVGLFHGLKLDVGVRYEHLAVKDQNQIIAGPLNGFYYSDVTVPAAAANPVTPRASLTYQYTSEDMVYASAAKGYRPGGGNVTNINSNPLCAESLKDLGLSSAPLTFKPDSLWSYELGAKDRLFDRRLSVDASVFYIKWTNIQSSIGLPSCINQFTGNRGEAISRGFDLQLSALVTSNIKFGAQVGYTDAYYPHTAYGAPAGSFIPLLYQKGDKLGSVIPWTAAANLEYSRSVSGFETNALAYVRFDYRWLDAAPRGNPLVAGYDPVSGPFPDPAYEILNIRLGLRHEGWDISTYVNNATHSDPLLGYSHTPPPRFTPNALYYGSAIRPLTFGITTWYRF
jgi:outer membrane receptor protein involved in Fe transport